MALTLLLLSPHASTSFPVSQLIGTKPWCEARIDYSAANEFIAAHYGKTRYFEKDRKTEPIYNAREGVQQHLPDEGTHYRPASLSECGFTLVQQEKPADTDWTDLNSIRETYLPRVRDALTDSIRSRRRIIQLVSRCYLLVPNTATRECGTNSARRTSIRDTKIGLRGNGPY